MHHAVSRLPSPLACQDLVPGPHLCAKLPLPWVWEFVPRTALSLMQQASCRPAALVCLVCLGTFESQCLMWLKLQLGFSFFLPATFFKKQSSAYESPEFGVFLPWPRTFMSKPSDPSLCPPPLHFPHKSLNNKQVWLLCSL